MAVSAYPLLTALRDRLAGVDGVVTCRIGLEANMTPEDYPMVRIVPSAVRLGAIMGLRQVDALVYFGQPVHEFTTGLEGLYSSLMALEVLLLNAAQAAPGVRRFEYVETILDEDRVDGFKLMAMRVVIEG